jgi:hypothetical protein
MVVTAIMVMTTTMTVRISNHAYQPGCATARPGQCLFVIRMTR